MAALIVVVVIAAVVLAVTALRWWSPGEQAVAAERIDVDRNDVTIQVVGSFGDTALAPGPFDAGPVGSAGDLNALGAGPLAASANGDAAVAAVLSDLQDFWAAELSADGGPGLRPPAGGYVSMDSSSTAGGSALCISIPRQITGNAFYCPNGDGIVFDSSALVPVLLGSYGSAGLAGAFAHEFGHAVQAQIGPTPQDRQLDPEQYPAILIEAQADCDAGAFLAWVSGAGAAASGSSTSDPTDGAAADLRVAEDPRVHLPQASLVRAVAPLLDFRDPATVSPADPTAHGLGLDRLGFALTGFRGGTPACTSMTPEDLQLTLGREGVTTSPPSTLPRYASTRDVLDAATASVRGFAVGLPNAPELPADLAADPADLARAAALGQFAAAAAVAQAAGRALGSATDPASPGSAAETAATAATAACFTGAWTASVFGRAGVDELGSWPTDADEALDLIRSRPGATFAELAGYSDGFHQGWASCG